MSCINYYINNDLLPVASVHSTFVKNIVDGFISVEMTWAYRTSLLVLEMSVLSSANTVTTGDSSSFCFTCFYVIFALANRIITYEILKME